MRTKDKGGDPEVFQEFQVASDILLDPNKRAIYNREGMAGFDRGGDLRSSSGGFGSSPNLTAEDIFHRFFRRESNQKFQTDLGQPKRGDNVTEEVEMTLEDIYSGKQINVAITRDRPCMACYDKERAMMMSRDGASSSGATGAEAGMDTCRDCRGTGMREIVKQMGPNIINHVSTPCTTCEGRGSLREQQQHTLRCRVCSGSKTTKDRAILPVRVDRGIPDGSKIYFRGEGALPTSDAVPGDAVIMIKQRPHQVFERDGNDLRIKIILSLTECLCGYERDVVHLDGHILKLRSRPCQVTKPGSEFMLHGEGMPVPVGTRMRVMQKGRLFVYFDVYFPDSLSPEVSASILAAAIPPGPVSDHSDKTSPRGSSRCGATGMTIEGEDEGGSSSSSSSSSRQAAHTSTSTSTTMHRGIPIPGRGVNNNPNNIKNISSSGGNLGDSLLWNTATYTSPGGSPFAVGSSSSSNGSGSPAASGSSSSLLQRGSPVLAVPSQLSQQQHLNPHPHHGTPMPDADGIPAANLQPFSAASHEPFGSFLCDELKSFASGNIQGGGSGTTTADADSDSETHGSPQPGCGQQ
jgi:DnaJ family protein A protein 2